MAGCYAAAVPRRSLGNPAWKARLERIAFGVVWVAVIVLLAFGAAGLASSMAHPPAGFGRPELTWAGDRAVRPALLVATDDLVLIADDVDRLGLLGRGALAALAGSQFETLDETITNGSEVVLRIRNASAALNSELTGLVGGTDAELRLSEATRSQHARLVDAAALTEGLAAEWARLVNGSLSAARLSSQLTRHDQQVIAAIEAGVTRDFETAIDLVDEATAALDAADELRDRLANTVDVTTLNEWLRRNRDYDVALKRLYVAFAASPDKVTPEMRAAEAAEKEARSRLPKTTRNLVIIMGEIGRGGLNQAVIGIESVRGRLAAALTALGVTEPEPTPTAPRTPSPTPAANTSPGPSGSP